MNPNETAEKLGIDTQELFRRAYAMFGHIYGGPGPVADHSWWKKWNNVPLNVKKYCNRWQTLRAMTQ